jgi:hypothetical protein
VVPFEDEAAVPFVMGDDAYVVASGVIRRLDPVTLEVLDGVAVPGRVVAVQDGDGVLWVYAPRDGSLRRIVDGVQDRQVQVAPPGARRGLTLAAGRPVLFDADGATVEFVDRRSGRPDTPLSLPAPGGLVQGPSLDGSRVWVAQADGRVLGIAPDGAALEVDLDMDSPRRPEVAGDRVHVPAVDGVVVVLDEATAVPVAEPADLEAAAEDDFSTFVDDGVVWWNVPSLDDALGTIEDDGSVTRVDVDTDALEALAEDQVPTDRVVVEPVVVEPPAPPTPPVTVPPIPGPPVSVPPVSVPVVAAPPVTGTPPTFPVAVPTTGAPVTNRPAPTAPTAATAATAPTAPTAPTTPSTPVPTTPTTPVPTTPTTPVPTTPTTPVPTTPTTAAPVVVPDVGGQTPGDACLTIAAAGLACQQAPLDGFAPNPGVVVGQSPGPGTATTAGAPVTVQFYTSAGVEVPETRGVRSAADACATITNAGLQCNQDPRPSSGPNVPPGAVFDQSEAPGTRVAEGSTVTIAWENTPSGMLCQTVPGGDRWATTYAVVSGACNDPLGVVFTAPTAGTVPLCRYFPEGSFQNTSQHLNVVAGCPEPSGFGYFRPGEVIGHVYNFVADGPSGRARTVFAYVWNSNHYYSLDSNSAYAQEHYVRREPNARQALPSFEVW